MGIWPSKKALVWWINTHWEPKGHLDLKLGLKGLFTMIITNLEDKNCIFEIGP